MTSFVYNVSGEVLEKFLQKPDLSTKVESAQNS
jgi:hypothetical protein